MMHIGLMWFDDDPRKPLAAKIDQAAARYREKYGRAPNACFVSAGEPAAQTPRNGVRIIPVSTMRPNYLWIGVDDTVESRR